MRYEDGLDKEVPQGNPQSFVCRWCSRPREADKRDFLICRVCDAPTRF